MNRGELINARARAGSALASARARYAQAKDHDKPALLLALEQAMYVYREACAAEDAWSPDHESPKDAKA